MATKWNEKSGVTVCGPCQGSGKIWSNRRPTVDDPYPEKACKSCDGEHLPECPVCGFQHVVPGFDCIVCETVYNIPVDSLSLNFSDDFDAAIAKAMACMIRASQLASQGEAA